MSDYRDARGRFRSRSGLDILEEYSACILIGAIVLAPLWVGPFCRLAQVWAGR